MPTSLATFSLAAVLVVLLPGPDTLVVLRNLVKGGRPGATGYTAGLLTDLLNPKVGVFFVTFLPGFVPHGYSVAWASLLFGALFVVLTAAYFAILLTASRPVTRLMENVRLRRRMDRCTGRVLIGFGLRLALEP
jgi:threonine/homoserine/homoserine lactone efflux protein